MRQEDSILLLGTEADEANTSIQRRKLKRQKPLRGSMSNKPPHILISLMFDLRVHFVKVAERGALPTESISSSRWRSLMLRISLRERRSSSSRGRGESCGDKVGP